MIRLFPLALALLAGNIFFNAATVVEAQTLSSPSPALAVIPTFEAAGLELDHGQGDCGSGCDTVTVQYRKAGQPDWRDAVRMIYDPTTTTGTAPKGQYRSSIVDLAPETSYEVKVTVNESTEHYQTFATWKETGDWPIGQTTIASGPVTVTTSGTPDGYHLVDGTGTVVYGGSECVRINASYVIVRGFECAYQTSTPVFVEDGVTDVLIEELDIHGWTASKKGAITIGNNDGHTETTRIVIQRNHVHDPGWGLSEHEWGGASPYAVMVREEHGGNHVIRYNTLTASDEHMWRDALGGMFNDSEWGFPGANSDIYGNYISHCGDDCIEAEGGGRNVRIWGNFLHEYGVAIAAAGVAKGPLYIFRNVGGRLNGLARGDGLQSGAIKVTTEPMSRCADCGDRHGRHYVFHNTFPNTVGLDGSHLQAGNHWGGNPKAQTVVNTIFDTTRYAFADGKCFYRDQANAYWHNLYWESESLNSCWPMVSGIQGRPRFTADFTPTPAPGEAAYFHLEDGAPGHDNGVFIPNFSESYHGAAPDIGAHEAGSPPMCFGHACSAAPGEWHW